MVADNLVKRSRRAWMMGQAYQEPWGPYELDARGNIVYLPGGAPHWLMPTPAQIKWQAWSAMACGARGMFYFLYRWPTVANPAAAASQLPAALRERVNSDAPRALVYDDGRATPQYEAMAVAFAQIAEAAPLLSSLAPGPAHEAWQQPGQASAVVRLLTRATDGQRYLVVVGPYAGNSEVRATLGPHITGLRDVATGESVPLVMAGPFRAASFRTTPGEGRVYECVVDAGAVPAGYSDDFTSEKYKTDAVNGAEAMVRRQDGGLGAFLGAAHGGLPADQAFLVYDLDQRLGPLAAGGVRMLMYAGGCNPPTFRGAFWSVSGDGVNYRPLSANEFAQPVVFTERYLKVGVSWQGSSSPEFYGKLSSFTVAQWPAPATE